VPLRTTDDDEPDLILDVLKDSKYALTLYCQGLDHFQFLMLRDGLVAAITRRTEELTERELTPAPTPADGDRAHAGAQARLGAGATESGAGSPD
jgi:hypothetical protein